MRKHILTLVTLLFLSFTALAQSGMPTFDQLPANAQEFVNTYFKDHQVKYVFVDKEFAETEYKVRFENGTEIEFNGRGEWKEVSGNKNCIPTAYILKEVTDYVSANFNNMCITSVEKEFKRIKIELDDDLEVEFNDKGKFISFDD